MYRGNTVSGHQGSKSAFGLLRHQRARSAMLRFGFPSHLTSRLKAATAKPSRDFAESSSRLPSSLRCRMRVTKRKDGLDEHPLVLLASLANGQIFVSCVIAYVLSGHRGIYQSQRIGVSRAHGILLTDGMLLGEVHSSQNQYGSTSEGKPTELTQSISSVAAPLILHRVCLSCVSGKRCPVACPFRFLLALENRLRERHQKKNRPQRSEALPELPRR